MLPQKDSIQTATRSKCVDKGHDERGQNNPRHIETERFRRIDNDILQIQRVYRSLPADLYTKLPHLARGIEVEVFAFFAIRGDVGHGNA